MFYSYFLFSTTTIPEIYTLSLHDALPIFPRKHRIRGRMNSPRCVTARTARRTCTRGRASSRPSSRTGTTAGRSEEHTSELQSQSNLVCRLLLEKKNG